MAIDPSIPLGVRPPQIDSPQQVQAMIGQQRDQQQTQQIRALQIQEHQQNVETTRAEQVKTQRVQALFAGPTPPSEAAIMSAMGPEDGMKMIRGLAALQTDNQKQYASQQELLRDVLAGMDVVPEGMRAELYPAVRKNLLDRQLITDKDAPETYDPQWFQQARNFGKDPAKTAEPYTLAPGAQRFGADNKVVASVAAKAAEPPNVGSFEDYLVRYAAEKKRPVQTLSPKDVRSAKAAFEAAGRAPRTGSNDPGPLETVIGPDGKPIRVRRADAIGKAPGASTEKASSGVQKKVLAFFNRAQQADVDLEGLEDTFIAKLGKAGQTRLALAPNFAQSAEGQRYNQAQRAFTEARLRKDSGAAIPAHEFDSDRKTYFVEFGDTPANIAQKRRARGAMLASLGFESGQALGEFVGDADEAAAIVKGYRDRSAGTQSPDATAKTPKKIGRFEVEVMP